MMCISIISSHHTKMDPKFGGGGDVISIMGAPFTLGLFYGAKTVEFHGEVTFAVYTTGKIVACNTELPLVKEFCKWIEEGIVK